MIAQIDCWTKLNNVQHVWECLYLTACFTFQTNAEIVWKFSPLFLSFAHYVWSLYEKLSPLICAIYRDIQKKNKQSQHSRISKSEKSGTSLYGTVHENHAPKARWQYATSMVKTMSYMICFPDKVHGHILMQTGLKNQLCSFYSASMFQFSSWPPVWTLNRSWNRTRHAAAITLQLPDHTQMDSRLFIATQIFCRICTAGTLLSIFTYLQSQHKVTAMIHTDCIKFTLQFVHSWRILWLCAMK